MRLRQKLFTAILAAMVLMFLLLSLASMLNALEAQQARRNLEGRLDAVARECFLATVDRPAPDFADLSRRLAPLGEGDWDVVAGGEPLLAPGRTDLDSMIEVERHGAYALVRTRVVAGLEPVRWLPTLFWALASGTAVLLLVVYGMLLRLVLRPVEDLVAASRSLSAGGRPPRVPGEDRPDEMGDLIKVFNRMAAEVVISREDLKRRVEEATHEREKALQRLALEQRLSATGKLAAGVAHEINNPLGGMINAARTLAGEKGLSPRAAEYVQLIKDGLGRITSIVERLRSFIRARADVGSVDVVETMRGALSFARHRVDRESVELEERFPAEGATVTGDAGELQQVFLNLVLNGLDAMLESETRRLTVSIGREDVSVVVEVSDTGVGMNQEQLANAFDLFYSTKQSGTGLGLAIAHKIVTDHGGEIELEGAPGTGTTVRMRLPSSDTAE